jgi:hypothetical protein
MARTCGSERKADRVKSSGKAKHAQAINALKLLVKILQAKIYILEKYKAKPRKKK